MASHEKPYGDINIFPAISPSLLIMFFGYIPEVLDGAQWSKKTHENIVTVATIFTYGAIPFSIISYSTFKHFILPILNYLPNKLHIESYFLNVIIVLLIIEVIFAMIFISYYGVGDLVPQFMAAAFPTALVALNCFGHICFFKFLSGLKKCLKLL